MRHPVIAALLALPLALAGCAGAAPAPDTPNVVYVTATPPVIAADVPAGDSPCTHLLWPLDAGNQWTYRLTTADATTEQALRAELAPSGAVVLASGLDARPMICGEDALAGLPPLPVGHPALGAGGSARTLRGACCPRLPCCCRWANRRAGISSSTRAARFSSRRPGKPPRSPLARW